MPSDRATWQKNLYNNIIELFYKLMIESHQDFPSFDSLYHCQCAFVLLQIMQPICKNLFYDHISSERTSGFSLCQLINVLWNGHWKPTTEKKTIQSVVMHLFIVVIPLYSNRKYKTVIRVHETKTNIWICSFFLSILAYLKLFFFISNWLHTNEFFYFIITLETGKFLLRFIFFVTLHEWDVFCESETVNLCMAHCQLYLPIFSCQTFVFFLIDTPSCRCGKSLWFITIIATLHDNQCRHNMQFSLSSIFHDKNRKNIWWYLPH